VTLIRAAAKNHERVTLVCDPADYESVLEAVQKGKIPFEVRKSLAVKGFRSTAHYDRVISEYLSLH
jgi:phosphoribosylaminoimidazolecarboxamide formyltransferase/IMP cyclohydrolase